MVAVGEDVGRDGHARGYLVRVEGRVARGLDRTGGFCDDIAPNRQVPHDLGVVNAAAGDRVAEQVGEEHPVGRLAADASAEQFGADGEGIGVPVPDGFGDLPQVRVVQVGGPQDAAQVIAELPGGEDRAEDGPFGEGVVGFVHVENPRSCAQVGASLAGTARSLAYFSALRIQVRHVAVQSFCVEPLPRW